MRKLLLSLSLLVFAAFSLQAQSGSGKYAKISGRVLEDSPTGNPVGFATIQMQPSGVYTSTEPDGSFGFKNIDPGKISLQIQFVGFETIDTVFTVAAGREYYLEFKMKETSFRLNEVSVVAERSKAGNSTSSKISRQALDHMQANSLDDIMSLLPGGVISNPSLNSANSITLRAASPTMMNALGTAIIMDGAQLSNNANLQALSPTISGGTGAVGGGAGAGTGVDLRGVSMDNIESVEVIRGVPSVEYGDMTSGAVIVKTKAGRSPLNVRAKINPNIYSASVGKGIQLGRRGGALNLSADYTKSSKSQTENYAYYQRFLLKGVYSKFFGDNFKTNTTLDFNFQKDTRNQNPDDKRSQLSSSAKNIGFRFNTNGDLSFHDAGWLKSLYYNVSVQYTNKHSRLSELLENAYAAYSMAFADGAILSNKPGMRVYDEDGVEITNIPSSERDSYATYLPNAYNSSYDLYGKELTANAKVLARFNKDWGTNNNNMVAGVEFKTDGNKGRGIVYDMAKPPLRAVSTGSASHRPRAFSDVPFVNQVSVFFQDSYTHSFGDGRRDLRLTAGVRWDNINGKNVVAPRVNTSYEIAHDRLWVRLGYGKLAKAPTSLYLNPQNAYFDMVHFNTLGDDRYAKDDQLLIGSTRVFNTENPDLEVAVNTKYEVGIDWNITKKIRFSLTGYMEEMKNGYTMGTDISCFHLLPYVEYAVRSYTPGSIPVLYKANSYNVWFDHSKPLNNIYSQNKGVEYEIDFGRVDPIRTSFYLSGAWMQSKVRDNGHSFSTNQDRNNLERHIGVYEKGVETNFYETFNTQLRITHNIPKIGFVVSLIAQAEWYTKDWTEYGNDTMFESYLSYKDGQLHPFDPSKKDDPEFAYLFHKPSENRFLVEKSIPTLIFNFTISKEIGDLLTASFMVNNLFNSRPKYKSKVHPESYITLGLPTFFGFDIKLNIK